MDLAGGRRESGEIDGVEVEKRNEDATRVKKKKIERMRRRHLCKFIISFLSMEKYISNTRNHPRTQKRHADYGQTHYRHNVKKNSNKQDTSYT